MKMQTRIIASLLCLSAIPFAAAADFEDNARVVRVTPQMQQYSQPRQECRTVMVPVAQPQSTGAGAIIGGIAGGVLGHQVGRGTGRTVGTVVGAVGGAVVGNEIESRNTAPAVGERPVQECRTVDVVESRPAGYEVTYTYRGQTFTSVLPYNPGKTLRVQVSVNPM